MFLGDLFRIGLKNATNGLKVLHNTYRKVSTISRDFWEKCQNDCSKTAEISKISRGCDKKI